MLISLTRTGGIIPMTKKADKEVDWTEDDVKQLLKHMKNEAEDPGEGRDASEYHLTYNAGTFPVDLEKVPTQYKKTFEDLKENLAIVKPG